MLATDAAALLAQVPAPVTFVVPTEDSLTPEAYLARVCAERPGFELLRVPGDRDLPFASPAEVIRAIDPDDAEGIALAEKAGPATDVRRNPIFGATGGVENALLRAGVLNLIAAAIIVALNPVPTQLLTTGFALWVLFASASAILGAVTMKGKTAGTRFTFTTTALPTLLMGLAGLALAAALFLEPDAARRFFGIAVAVYATARGATDLWVALRVGSQTSTPRWLLFAGSALGFITAAAIVFGPNHGRGVVRLTLALYLGLTGVSLLAYVWSERHAAKRRVRELLGR